MRDRPNSDSTKAALPNPRPLATIPARLKTAGEMPEWPIGRHWKCRVPLWVPWVRIPLSPLNPQAGCSQSDRLFLCARSGRGIRVHTDFAKRKPSRGFRDRRDLRRRIPLSPLNPQAGCSQSDRLFLCARSGRGYMATLPLARWGNPARVGWWASVAGGVSDECEWYSGLGVRRTIAFGTCRASCTQAVARRPRTSEPCRERCSRCCFA